MPSAPPRLPNPASAGAAQHLRIPAAICLSLFGFAFVAGSQSCEWGLDAYFMVGVLVLVVLAITPWILQRHWPARNRLWLALGYTAAGLVVWIAGFALAGFRLLCRLL